MIRAYWEDGRLTTKTTAGVIKLIPKNQNTEDLTNWRPLTMLTLTEKVVAKIIANRIWKFVGKLVDSQQTGFLAGRDILDNLLSFKLAQELALTRKQSHIFLKLDFAKAYDRVDHGFLSEVMRTMKFDGHLIMLVKGLVENTHSKVHFNGLFTSEILLNRGVRQGCPLSPLLFALTTQPLMCLVKRALDQGDLQGMKLEDGTRVCHQLFADDTGLFLAASREEFDCARRVIQHYKRISGALLNIHKSKIIPLYLATGTAGDWMVSTGCQVAVEGEIIEYLGCPIAHKVKPSHEASFIAKKLRSRLCHWTFKSLTLAGRVILLKHVLRAIPTFHFMVLSLSGVGFEELEQICRNFLWGTAATGKTKKALIRWSAITMEKDRGGLGILTFKDQAMTLKMRHVTKLVTAQAVDWVKMANELISRSLRSGPNKKEQRHWTPGEALLLNGYMQIKGSPTLRMLLRGWDTQIRSLAFQFGLGRIPRSLSIEQLILLFFHDKLVDREEQNGLRRFMASRQIKQMEDLQQDDGTWWPVEQVIGRVRSTRSVGTQAFRDLHEVLLGGSGLADITLDCYEAWRWKRTGKTSG